MTWVPGRGSVQLDATICPILRTDWEGEVGFAQHAVGDAAQAVPPSGRAAEDTHAERMGVGDDAAPRHGGREGECHTPRPAHDLLP